MVWQLWQTYLEDGDVLVFGEQYGSAARCVEYLDLPWNDNHYQQSETTKA